MLSVHFTITFSHQVLCGVSSVDVTLIFFQLIVRGTFHESSVVVSLSLVRNVRLEMQGAMFHGEMRVSVVIRTE